MNEIMSTNSKIEAPTRIILTKINQLENDNHNDNPKKIGLMRRGKKKIRIGFFSIGFFF